MSEIQTRTVRITSQEPGVISDGLALSREAYLEIDTTVMRQEFIRQLMHHIKAGHIRVKTAKLVRRVRAGAPVQH